ncbi:MAG: N-acetyltransferase [Candidatus Devosia euplotis]|nr:N-acetyltransferase [Candidatus Devosia euplotis]
MGGYVIEPSAPGMDDYLRLRVAAGLRLKTAEQASISLPNTWHGVTVTHAGRVIGMGRIIGDGGTAFQIIDIALEPAHHGPGPGKTIMAVLMAHLNAHAPQGGLCQPDRRWRCPPPLR